MNPCEYISIQEKKKTQYSGAHQNSVHLAMGEKVLEKINEILLLIKEAQHDIFQHLKGQSLNIKSNFELIQVSPYLGLHDKTDLKSNSRLKHFKVVKEKLITPETPLYYKI